MTRMVRDGHGFGCVTDDGTRFPLEAGTVCGMVMGALHRAAMTRRHHDFLRLRYFADVLTREEWSAAIDAMMHVYPEVPAARRGILQAATQRYREEIRDGIRR